MGTNEKAKQHLNYKVSITEQAFPELLSLSLSLRTSVLIPDRHLAVEVLIAERRGRRNTSSLLNKSLMSLGRAAAFPCGD